MRNVLFFVLLVMFCVSAQNKLNIAVMELDGNGISESDIAGLSNRLRTQLFNTGKFEVIERSKMDEILKEQGFQQSGCTNTDCAIEVGQLIGVKKIVVGSVDKVGSIFSVDIRMVDVTTGKIDRTATEDCAGCSIDNVLITTIGNTAKLLAGLQVDNSTSVSMNKVHQQIERPSTGGIQEWERLGLKDRNEWINFKKSGITIEEWDNLGKYTKYVKYYKRSGMTAEDYSENLKSITGTFLLSSFTPGGGHFYLKNYGFGIGYLLTEAVLVSCAIPLYGDYQTEEASLFLFLSAGGIKIIDVIHASIYASKYNRGTLRKQPKNYPFKNLALSPTYNIERKEPGLKLSLKF